MYVCAPHVCQVLSVPGKDIGDPGIVVDNYKLLCECWESSLGPVLDLVLLAVKPAL